MDHSILKKILFTCPFVEKFVSSYDLLSICVLLYNDACRKVAEGGRRAR